MELEAENWRLGGTTLVRGVSGELEDENWRLCSSTTSVRGVSGELEDENWGLCSTTLVRGAIKLRTGDLVVQLQYAAESSLAASLAPLQLSHVSRPPGSLERLIDFIAYSKVVISITFWRPQDTCFERLTNLS